MKNAVKFTLYCLLTFCVMFVGGCGKKADENKPVTEIKAEAEKMSVDQLRTASLKYKEAMLAKKAELEKIAAKLKEIPVTKMLSDEAAAIKADVDKLNKSFSALKERFDVYYQKVQEKGGDVSNLKI